MDNSLSVFAYQGNNITFSKGHNVMINATEMAKPFRKRCNDFLSSKSTKELITSLSAKTEISATGLVVVNQGGTNQGTWLHEDLALIFAQWLSPGFYLWCNDRIKELLTQGVATVSSDDEVIAQAMEVLQRRLEAQRVRAEYEAARAEALQKQTEKMQGQIDYINEKQKKLLPAATFAKAVETSDSSVLVGELAKLICQNGIPIGQNRLFDWLRQNGYLCSKGECYNLPTQKSMDAGLMEIKKTSIVKPTGVTIVSSTPKITGKGQIYFVNKFLTDKIK